MNENIIFLKVKEIKSKKNGKKYYILNYIDSNYDAQMEFISIDLYNQLVESDIEPLETVQATYELNRFKKAVITAVETI